MEPEFRFRVRDQLARSDRPNRKASEPALLPESWPLLKSGEVKLLIDDPTTKEGDGYATDFVRILMNGVQ